MANTVKAPSLERMQQRWARRTQEWAQKRAAEGLLAERLPSPLWCFDLGLRKVSRRSRNTATITLNRSHLRHLGLQIGDYLRIVLRTDGTLTLRKVSERELSKVQTRAKLTILPGKKGKQAAS